MVGSESALVPASALAELRTLSDQALPHTCYIYLPERGRAPGGKTTTVYRLAGSIPCRLAPVRSDTRIAAEQPVPDREWTVVTAVNPPIAIPADARLVVQGETDGVSWWKTLRIVRMPLERAFRTMSKYGAGERDADEIFIATAETTALHRTAASGGQRFVGELATTLEHRTGASGGQRFEGIAVHTTSKTRARAAGDNGILFKYDNDDPAFSDWAALGGVFTGPANRTYFDENGVLQTVGANARRNAAWVRTSSGLWKKVWLLEGQSTNLLPWTAPTKAQLFGSGTDVTDDPAYDGVGGFAKWLRFGTSLIGTNNAYFAPSVQAGITYCISVVVEMEDGSQPVHSLGSNAGDFSLLISSGSAANPGVMRLGTSNRYLCWAVLTMGSSGSGATGVYRFSTQSGKAFRVTGFQLEPLLFPTSRIITTGSAQSRAAEAPSAPWLYAPSTELTALYDAINLGAAQIATSGHRLWWFGNNGASNPVFVLRGLFSLGGFGADHVNASGRVWRAMSSGLIAYGQQMEFRDQLLADGAVDHHYALDGGAEARGNSSSGTVLAPAGAWSAAEVRLEGAFVGLERFIIARGRDKSLAMLRVA